MSVSQKLLINTSHNYRACRFRLLQFGIVGQSPLTLEAFSKHDIIFVLKSDKDLKMIEYIKIPKFSLQLQLVFYYTAELLGFDYYYFLSLKKLMLSLEERIELYVA